MEACEQKKKELQQLIQGFEYKKQLFINKLNTHEMIKSLIDQRFDKSKILNVLEEKINHLDEQSMQEMELKGSQFGLFEQEQNSQEEIKNFKQRLLKFYEDRKAYHVCSIQKEKLEEIL